MPLRERMALYHDQLLEARSLAEKIAPGRPRVSAPKTVAEAYDLIDAARVKEVRRAPRARGGFSRRSAREFCRCFAKNPRR